MLLTEIDQSPAELVKQGIAAEEAFSCALCGACETVCPQGLSPKDMFAGRRLEAINSGEFDIDDYCYLFPDRKNNIMSMYRQYQNIDYRQERYQGNSRTCFFPGCTLMTYSPKLTQAVYRRLQDSCDCGGIWTACCGKPLEQMGLQQRTATMHTQIQEFLQLHQITRLITACPGCYYALREIVKDCAVSIQTVYEVLAGKPQNQGDRKLCTIHDACPDRWAGVFASQVRTALRQCGFTIQEMEHNRANTMCCGSGGQLAHFRPDFTDKLVNLRLAEARQSGAELLVSYCLSCVLKFDGRMPEIPVTHALNLLLGEPEDFRGAKERAARLFAGPEGEKLWEKMMAD